MVTNHGSEVLARRYVKSFSHSKSVIASEVKPLGDSVRKKNPTKTQVKEAAKKIARAAGRTAWRATKFTGRVAGRSAKAAAKTAAAEVKEAICRKRNPRYAPPKPAPLKGFEIRMGKYPRSAGEKVTRELNREHLRLMWTAATLADAKFIAKEFAQRNPSLMVTVDAE